MELLSPISDANSFYVVSSGSLGQSLKDGLQKFSNARRYEYWSQYVKSLVCHVAEMEEEGISSFPETQMLISAWRMLLILSTTHVCRGKPSWFKDSLKSSLNGPHEFAMVCFMFPVRCDAANGRLDQAEAFHGRPGRGQSRRKSSILSMSL